MAAAAAAAPLRENMLQRKYPLWKYDRMVRWLAQGTQGLYVVGTWKLRPDWVKDGELPSLIELNLNLCLALPPSTVSYLFYFYAI